MKLPPTKPALATPESRLTLLTYRLPELPSHELAARELIFRQSVREFVQMRELTSWESKDLVLKRAHVAVPEEGTLVRQTLSQARQICVEKGVLLRDLSAYMVRGEQDDWRTDPMDAVPGGALARQDGNVVEEGLSSYHPRRTSMVVAPTYMYLERCFHALDSKLGVPIPHDSLLEFDERGQITRDIPGSMLQIPMLLVPLPATLSLKALSHEIALQRRRKLQALAKQGTLVLPDSVWQQPLPLIHPQRLRDDLFEDGLTTLVLSGFRKKHLAQVNSKGADALWRFVEQLVWDGVQVILAGSPALLELLGQDAVRQLFPQGPYHITSLRPNEVGDFMSYFWGVIGVDAPMPEEFVELAFTGAFQRGLIEHLLVDFNRRVNQREEDWRKALKKSSQSLTGDLKKLSHLYANVLANQAIEPSEAQKYQDELPPGVKTEKASSGNVTGKAS